MADCTQVMLLNGALGVNMSSLHNIKLGHRLLGMCSFACVNAALQLAADRPKVKGLIGGLPPASALWNLKLALAYYSTSQARLLSDLSTIAGTVSAGYFL